MAIARTLNLETQPLLSCQPGLLPTSISPSIPWWAGPLDAIVHWGGWAGPLDAIAHWGGWAGPLDAIAHWGLRTLEALLRRLEQLFSLGGVYLSEGTATLEEPATPESTDEGLVACWQDGDTRAFETLVKRYQNLAYTVCRRYLINPESAEDTAQDVFISLFKKMKGFRGESSFKSWFYRVLVNHCHNRYKKEARHRKRVAEARVRAQEVEALYGPPRSGAETHSDPDSANAMDPESAYAARQRQELLARALESIGRNARMVLLLREGQGLSYDEIAETLHLSAGTVKSRIHRARAELKAEVSRLRNEVQTR